MTTEGTAYVTDEGVPLDLAFGLPEPHDLIPKATARRRTRRVPKEVSALIGPQLSRLRTLELMASDGIDPSRCTVIWNVRGRPLKQAAARMTVPDLADLRAVRRLGSYHGAPNRIVFCPVLRGESREVTMAECESQLEWHHVLELTMKPKIDEILTQPFLMLWEHDGGNLVHVPDIATVSEGRLTVYDVKDDASAEHERTRLLFDLARRSLRLGDTGFEVLGSISKQREVNLLRLSRYRSQAPHLTDLVGLVQPQRPKTIGGVYSAIRQHFGLGSEFRLPAVDCPSLIGVDAAVYALAHGRAQTDLDVPLTMATRLEWLPPVVEP